MRRLRARGRISRTVLVVCVVATLVGMGVTALLLARNYARPSQSQTAESFLRDVRDGRFSKAFSLGTATFADGRTGNLTVDLGNRGSGACVNTWRLDQ